MASKKIRMPVILAIDFGTSQLRALLLNPKDPGNPWYCGPIVSDRICPPLNPSTSVVGAAALGAPNSLSAKYLMYLLSAQDNNALAVNPLSDTILGNGDKDTIREVLVNVLEQFKTLIDRNLPLTYNENIVLTIPGHWQKDVALKADYISIVREVFGEGNQSDNIHSYPDTEALAKYVRFSKPELVNDREKVLFLDFGAHCMVSDSVPSGLLYYILYCLVSSNSLF